MIRVQKGKMKRALLFLPIWACLITLSIIRIVVGLPKVKINFQRITIKKISNLCQRLFGIVRNPYRIGYPWYIPPYYISKPSPEPARMNMEKIHQLISEHHQEKRKA